MKQARLGLRNQAVHIPPCRQIERIDIQYGESRDQWIPPAVKEKTTNTWFTVGLDILKPHYHVTVYKKEVDLQSLVGYVGGYVGLFMGFALFHIPDNISVLINYLNRFLLSNGNI